MRIAVLISALFVSLIVHSQSQTYIHGTPYVEVTGEGIMEVVPDKIVLHISVSEFEKSKETLEDREVKMREALEGIGINTKESLAVRDVNSGYRYGRSIKTSKEYELTLSDPNLVLNVYIKLEEVAISNISVVEISHSRMKEFEQQVKLEAVKSQRSKRMACWLS